MHGASAQRTSLSDLILDSMSSGIVAVDTRGRVVSFNPAARRILGASEGELLQRPCDEVLAQQPVVARLLREALGRSSPLSRAELALEGAGGGVGPTLGFTLCPVWDAAGTRRGAAMIFRDLTPIERSGEQERLRERLAALGQMAAGLAHELRNPLASTTLLAGLLQRRLADRPEERALVAELRDELAALADTVDASLDFVRPLALHRDPVDPVRLLDEALATALARVPFEGQVERGLAADLPLLQADEEQLRTVLVNLLVNALEALREVGRDARLRLALANRAAEPSGQALRVGSDTPPASAVSPASRELVISIGDNGPGVPFELREKIFYPFFTTREEGSGVGLATAQKLVASHGGSLELESRPGEGSTFHVRLPLYQEAAP